MSKTKDEVEDLADQAMGIFEQGIEVHISKGDAAKLFSAIVAANALTYFTAMGFKQFVMPKLVKLRPRRKSEEDN